MTASYVPQLSVCVATRNRPDDLVRCLNSLVILGNLDFEVIVGDDASEELVSDRIQTTVAPTLLPRITVSRSQENRGCVKMRNHLARLAKAPYILCLDDDAQLINQESVLSGLKVLEKDDQVGAVALSQSYENGTLLPDQPAHTSYNCYTASYIGYGHILRRQLFLDLGGYREIFWAYYEEPEYCKRMLDHGSYVVYLPEASVIHYHSPIGRSRLNSIRNGCRNKCFAALYNEPMIMVALSVPLRIVIYLYQCTKLKTEYGINSQSEFQWLWREILSKFSEIWRDRKALKWSTFYEWHKIKTQSIAYEGLD